MQTAPISARASANLDLIRGLAALAVMIGHVRALFFVDYLHVLKGKGIVTALYFVTSLGHQAVLVFFLLSGFFISRSVFGSFQQSRWSWSTYLINRLTRLLLVLIPSLALCALWDRVGMTFPEAAPYYYHSIPAFGPAVIAANSSIAVLLGNLCFLQSIYVPTFGSNLPLWSLSYEFWYYMLFPVLLSVIIARPPFIKRLGYLLLGTAISLTLGGRMTLLFLVWLGGAGIGLLHDLRAKHIASAGRSWSLYGAAGAGSVLMVVTKLFVKVDTVADLLFGAAFAPVMYVFIEVGGSAVNRIYARLSRLIASFSYTLYLVHLPLLILIRAFLARVPRWQPDTTHVLYGTSLALLVLLYSFCLSRITEARTDNVRNIFIHARQHGLQSAFTKRLLPDAGLHSR